MAATKGEAALYRRVIESTPEPMLVVDAGGIIRLANGCAARIFGYEPGQLEGESIEKLLPERFRNGHVAQRQSYMRAPTVRPMAGRTELHGLHREGHEIPLRIGLGHADVGDEKLVVCVVHDVREQQYLSTASEAAQRLESIGRFACGIAHNVNNALTVIRNEADFLRERVDPGCAEDLDTIRRATDSAADMTRQVLAFARQRPQKLEPLQLDELVRDVERLLRGLLGEDIELRVRADDDAWAAQADRAGMTQALMNLASNARDAMPNGGLLTIDVRNVRLDDAYAASKAPRVEPGEYVLLSVADTGSGIADDALPYVFDPFYTTKGHAEGTGLGLSTVYGMVKQSGGFVWAYSEPERGTVFKLYLPRAAAATTRSQPILRQEAPQPNAPATVLLVEDDELVRRSARRVLRSQGFEVLEAVDPEQALALWEREGPRIDVVLSDFGMPGMNGGELAARLHALRPGLPVVLMSGYGPDLSGTPLAPPSDLPFVEKPFDRQTLLDVLHRALSG